jgi:hypothetical protein
MGSWASMVMMMSVLPSWASVRFSATKAAVLELVCRSMPIYGTVFMRTLPLPSFSSTLHIVTPM